MVDAGVRGVEASDPVGQHPDPLALETAKHRARGVGAERGGRDSGLPGEGLADRRAKLAGELAPGNDGGSGEHVLPLPGEAGDDDVLGMIGVGIVGLGRCLGLRGGGGLSGLRCGGSLLGEGVGGQQGHGGSREKG